MPRQLVLFVCTKMTYVLCCCFGPVFVEHSLTSTIVLCRCPPEILSTIINRYQVARKSQLQKGLNPKLKQPCLTGHIFYYGNLKGLVVLLAINGQAACGACTVHIDGDAVRSCSFAVQYAQNKHITTIEGLSSGEKLHPVQQAWIEEIVPQCGYCQPGFMMSVANLLEKIPNPTDEEIDDNITNICRCGTYYRMRKAIHRAAELKG